MIDATQDYSQPFARDQGKPFTTGPFLGGYVFVLVGSVAAGGSVAINHPLRVPPRHVEVISQILGEYPSRVAFSTNTPSVATVKFESAQSAGAALWMW